MTKPSITPEQQAIVNEFKPSAEQQAEIDAFKVIDDHEDDANTLFGRDRETERRSDALLRKFAIVAEVTLIDARVVEVHAAMRADQLIARRSDDLENMLTEQLQKARQDVLVRMTADLKELAKGSPVLDVVSRLLEISPMALHLLQLDGDGGVRKLAQAMLLLAKAVGSEKDPDFDIRERQTAQRTEIEQLRARRRRIAPEITAAEEQAALVAAEEARLRVVAEQDEADRLAREARGEWRGSHYHYQSLHSDNWPSTDVGQSAGRAAAASAGSPAPGPAANDGVRARPAAESAMCQPAAGAAHARTGIVR